MGGSRNIVEQEQAGADLEAALKLIKQSETELRAIVDALPAHAWCAGADGYNVFCNQQWLDYSGLSQETARGWSWRDAIHPDDVGVFVKKWSEVSTTGAPFDAEARFRRFDGEYHWFLVRAVPLKDESGTIIKWFGTNTDIEDRKKADAVLAGENQILEMVAAGKPLTAILEELCCLVDSISADSMSSVLLVDSANCLRAGAAPRFPRKFISVIDGIEIGPTVGSCGTAAHRKEQVIVTDIETDPLWADYRELARTYGLRAGWSTPILSPDRSVLGVFGIYWNKARSPSPVHFHLIDQITHLAAIAIERQRSQEALRASERFARGQVNAFTRTVEALAMESETDGLVGHVLRTITDEFDAHSSSVWRKDHASGEVSFEVALEGGKLVTKSDASIVEAKPFLPIQYFYPLPEDFRTGKPAVLEDIRQVPAFPWREHLLAQGIVTIFCVPMLIAGQVEGVTGIRFSHKRAFRPEEVELAKALANQAMLAMELTRLSAQNRQTAIMAERNRVARDIHDTLAQGFTGVIVQLEAAQEAICRGRTSNICAHLERAGELARESLREARRSVQALRPRALEGNPLAAALTELVANMTSGTAVEAKLTVDGEARELPPELENNLLRIGQEVLTNALRHARPTEFHVRLLFDADEISLHLRDNGCGFDPVERHEGFGLQGIRERTESMGGKFTIVSAKGQGASISIVLPIGATSTAQRK
ncbi:MAG TPA: GAF domain-containing protein [Candidatus Baltobacteraceae bacterium]|jgi:PAS domain S-box-containing protein|nr:GAF domain-containing protein [Candidatus Baltobacteraceae bacterium]